MTLSFSIVGGSSLGGLAFPSSFDVVMLVFSWVVLLLSPSLFGVVLLSPSLWVGLFSSHALLGGAAVPRLRMK